MNLLKPFKCIVVALLFTGMLLYPAVGSTFCFEEAGKIYNLPPILLMSIAKQESNFRPDAVNVNKNGSYDYGLMQINSSWAATLGKDGWAELADPCTNVKVGAWILRQCINDYGYGWKAIGCYNSRTPGKNEAYANRIAALVTSYRMQASAKNELK